MQSNVRMNNGFLHGNNYIILIYHSLPTVGIAVKNKYSRAKLSVMVVAINFTVYKEIIEEKMEKERKRISRSAIFVIVILIMDLLPESPE